MYSIDELVKDYKSWNDPNMPLYVRKGEYILEVTGLKHCPEGRGLMLLTEDDYEEDDESVQEG